MIEVFNIKKGLFYGVLNLNEYAISRNLSIKRQIETEGSKFLIHKMLNKNVNILYNQNGKPYLENESSHISISHSHDRLAIIINENEATGIDIELIRDKVKVIKTKFLSDRELIDAGDNVEKLLIYWAAKEALYKIYGEPEVEFIKHLFIQPFEINNLGKITGQINHSVIKNTFELHYQTLNNYILVYVLNKV